MLADIGNATDLEPQRNIPALTVFEIVCSGEIANTDIPHTQQVVDYGLEGELTDVIAVAIAGKRPTLGDGSPNLPVLDSVIYHGRCRAGLVFARPQNPVIGARH